MTERTPWTWPDLFGRATLILAVLAGILLVFMMVLITSAVLMRYVAGQPILGVNEIVQLTAVALTMLALPYATYTMNHVRADIFDPALGRWGRFVADIGSRLVSIFVLGHLVRRAWFKALDAYEYGDATNMLSLPIWPLYALILVGVSVSILVFAMQIVLIVRQGHAMGDTKHA